MHRIHMLSHNKLQIIAAAIASCCFAACAVDGGEDQPTEAEVSAALSGNDGCLFVSVTRVGDTVQASAVDHCGRASVDVCFEDIHSAFQLAQAACASGPNGPNGASWTFSASALIRSASAGGINHWPGPFTINTAAFASFAPMGGVVSVVDLPFTL